MEIFIGFENNAEIDPKWNFSYSAFVNFTIDNFLFQSTGEIKLINQLNFESTKQYTLIIRAADKGSPSKSTTSTTHATVVINVLDINEKPVFKKFYFETIAETMEINTFILTVSAQDEDEGTNGMLLYSIISGNDDDKFRLDGVSNIYVLSRFHIL